MRPERGWPAKRLWGGKKAGGAIPRKGASVALSVEALPPWGCWKSPPLPQGSPSLGALKKEDCDRLLFQLGNRKCVTVFESSTPPSKGGKPTVALQAAPPASLTHRCQNSRTRSLAPSGDSLVCVRVLGAEAVPGGCCYWQTSTRQALRGRLGDFGAGAAETVPQLPPLAAQISPVLAFMLTRLPLMGSSCTRGLDSLLPIGTWPPTLQAPSLCWGPGWIRGGGS